VPSPLTPHQYRRWGSRQWYIADSRYYQWYHPIINKWKCRELGQRDFHKYSGLERDCQQRAITVSNNSTGILNLNTIVSSGNVSISSNNGLNLNQNIAPSSNGSVTLSTSSGNIAQPALSKLQQVARSRSLPAVEAWAHRLAQQCHKYASRSSECTGRRRHGIHQSNRRYNVNRY